MLNHLEDPDFALEKDYPILYTYLFLGFGKLCTKFY